MDDGLAIVETRGETLRGAMMVIGFPTPGLVGSVAASYLVHTLDMAPIAYLVGDELPSTATMDEGVVNAPMRFYASRLVCGPDRSCEQLVVVLSDIPPPARLIHRLGRTLLDWAEAKGVQLVVAMEGQPIEKEEGAAEEEPAEVVAMTNRAGAPLLAKYGFRPANGVVSGFAGGLLLSSIGRSIPVLCVTARAHQDFPDARAAAQVIEAVNPLVPLLVLNTRPLRQKARQIEAQVRKHLEEQQGAQQTANGVRAPTGEGPGEMYR